MGFSEKFCQGGNEHNSSRWGFARGEQANTKIDHAKEKARGTQIKTPSPKEADPCFQTEESPIRVQPQTGSP